MRGKRYTEEQIIGVLKEAEAGVAAADICRALDEAGEREGYPEVIMIDNGPEFARKEVPVAADCKAVYSNS